MLDVGTGAGIAARRAASAVGPAGSVLGVDLSEGMLGVAAEASRQQGFSNVEFRRMDAEALDLPDESFDAVISLCAVSHFPNVSVALAEMTRVLRPGRRLVVATGCGRPPLGSGLLRYGVWRVLKKLSGFVTPQLWAPHAILGFIERQAPELSEPPVTDWGGGNPTRRLTQLVRAAGLVEVNTLWEGHVLRFDSAAEYWEAQTSIVTRVRKRLEALPPDRVAYLRREFLTRAQRVLVRGGCLYYPYGAFYVTGVRA